MGRRSKSLLGIAVLLGSLAGCKAFTGDKPVCVPNHPADPVMLIWTENIDDDMAVVDRIAPPRVEIMADGQVIANATRVSILSHAALNALTHRITTDLGGSTPGPGVVELERQDGQGDQGREDISLWPAGQPEVRGTVIYNPAPLTSRPGTSATPASGTQPLDAGLPSPWKDAIDALNTLTVQTLAHGKPYQTSDIEVIVSTDDNLLGLISDGKLTKSTGKRPWPAGIPHVPAARPGDPSTYSVQRLPVTGAAVATARHAFVPYLAWPATAQLYDDGIPGQHLGWYGIWHSTTPDEENPSAIPVTCPKTSS